jgi:Sulfotransferase domain
MHRRVKEALDFLIVGAQKSGTTSLHEYLRPHPQLYLPPYKEAPFFSHDHIYNKGWQAYFEGTFFDAPQDVALGKTTPHYMYGGLVNPADTRSPAPERVIPERIHALFPELRLIAILRDPIERCMSDLRMAHLEGREPRALRVAVQDALRPEMLAAARASPTDTNSYVTWGEYGRLLQPYFEIFGSENVLVLYTSDLASEPDRALRLIYRHIGVSENFTPPNLGQRYRVGGTRRRVPVNPYHVRYLLATNSTIHWTWQRMPRSVRRYIERSFRVGAYRFRLWNRKAAGPQLPGLEPALEQQLRLHYRDDRELLVSLTHEQPPWE